jgi:4-diphosphocytidyl-2-C-methyl-D-erythritol kinase
MISYPNVKVNLGLNVLRKREDGFHDLETLFVPYFDIHDTLEIISGDDYSRTSAALFAKYGSEPEIVQGISEDGKLMITIAREDGVDWDPLKDLTAKAYHILDRDFNLPAVKIFLEKTSPVGAGLGGGSADAAFALKMLNELFSLGLQDEQLASYAAELGSDCAFFVYNKPMIGEGRGEVLSFYEVNEIAFGEKDREGKKYELKVVVPEDIAVSTADAYRGIKPCMPEITLREALAQPVAEWYKNSLKNDFEATVFEKYPELGAIKQSLYDSGAVYAAMSGSGSALFAIYEI